MLKQCDELDNIRNNNSKAKNRHFEPIKKGSRTLKTIHSVPHQKLVHLPSWAIDHDQI